MAAVSLANLCQSIQNLDNDVIPPPPIYQSLQSINKRLKHAAYIAGSPPCGGGGSGGSNAPVYMITDDLVLMPMSTISIMTLLNKFGIKDVAALEEKVVHLGVDEAAKMLSASMQSKTVLTDVFLTPKGIKTEPKGNGVKIETVNLK